MLPYAGAGSVEEYHNQDQMEDGPVLTAIEPGRVFVLLEGPVDQAVRQNGTPRCLAVLPPGTVGRKQRSGLI